MTGRDCASIITISFLMLIAASNWGCSGGSATPPPIVVTVSPLSQALDENRSVTITALVMNDTTRGGVTWNLSGLLPGGKFACGNAPQNACGTLSNQTATSVTYNAPSSLQFGTINISVIATSVADSTKSASVSMTVVPPPSITTTSLPAASGGTAYNATLQGSGGIPPLSWSITSGSLPATLALSSDGTISGTPCAGGTSNFTVQVADSASPPLAASAQLSINVTLVPLSVATTSLPTAVTDAIYNQMVQATGGVPPYTWKVLTGALPSWATLNASTGKITGIPGTTGNSDFTLQVTDSECSPVTITQALSISAVTAASANDSELSGHYAFLFNGFDDTTGSQVAVAGSFAADGKGNITEGTEDENGPSGSALNVPLTGTYNIASNNAGALTITTSSGSKTYAVTLNAVSNGVAQKARFIEFDDVTGTSGQRGSGLLRLQDTSAFTSGGIAGPYAFGFSGQDSSGNRAAMVGAFSTDGTGKVTSGVADENVAGTATNPSLTGAFTTPTLSDGRASIILNPSNASSVNLTAYVVSASELLVMRTDAFSSDGLLSGTILSQTSTSFDNKALDSPEVYYQLGNDVAEIGLLVPDGNGGLAVTRDQACNSCGTLTFTTSYSVLSAGRVTISGWDGTAGSPTQGILYLVDKNKAFLLGYNGNATEFGFVEPQAGVPAGGFTTSSFSGTFSANTLSPSVGNSAAASGVATIDGKGNFSETASVSTTSGLFVDQAITGAYGISGNGRGTVTSLVITTAGVHSLVALLSLPLLLLGRLMSRRNPWRFALAAFLLLVLLAVLFAPTGRSMRRPPPPNQLVFYMISPTKAVMVHEAFNTPPGITILEQ